MKSRIFGPGVLLMLVCVGTGNTDEPKQKLKLLDNIRGSRYCELLVVKGEVKVLKVTVYNTLGCNDCPAEAWNKVNLAKLTEQLKARKIIKNGPRFFLMDKIGQYNKSPEKVELGGIEMVERATVSLSLPQLLQGKGKPYEEKSVHRTTHFVFNKGREEYFLKDGKHTYIMQSFSQTIDAKLTEKDLESLGKRLTLPPSWTFEVRTLDSDMILDTQKNGMAVVIQDDLENTYQRID